MKIIDDYIANALAFAHLPKIPQDTIFGKVGFYAEALFLLLAIFLIVNILFKIPRREEFFTGWTGFLLIMLPICFIIFLIAWLIPDKVGDFWIDVKPHM